MFNSYDVYQDLPIITIFFGSFFFFISKLCLRLNFVKLYGPSPRILMRHSKASMLRGLKLITDIKFYSVLLAIDGVDLKTK